MAILPWVCWVVRALRAWSAWAVTGRTDAGDNPPALADHVRIGVASLRVV
jgi:hypothetical protein